MKTREVQGHLHETVTRKLVNMFDLEYGRKLLLNDQPYMGQPFIYTGPREIVQTYGPGAEMTCR